MSFFNTENLILIAAVLLRWADTKAESVAPIMWKGVVLSTLGVVLTAGATTI